MARKIDEPSGGFLVIGGEWTVWCRDEGLAFAVQRDLESGLPPFPWMPRESVDLEETVDEAVGSPAPGR